MACITEAGILTAALLPHFFTVALMAASLYKPCIYIVPSIHAGVNNVDT
jgi:hypothetical protein